MTTDLTRKLRALRELSLLRFDDALVDRLDGFLVRVEAAQADQQDTTQLRGEIADWLHLMATVIVARAERVLEHAQADEPLHVLRALWVALQSSVEPDSLTTDLGALGHAIASSHGRAARTAAVRAAEAWLKEKDSAVIRRLWRCASPASA